LTPSHIEQAAEFFRSLNSNRSSAAARELHNASEACFTLAEHLQTVERRITRLSQIDPTSPLGQPAADLVKHSLLPAWHRVRDSVLSANATELTTNDRCLSPSDFGFHNALERDGRLVFIDFEYAGWDDPAKAVCDFFCQPAVPVPLAHFDTIAAAFTAHCEYPADQVARARLLLSVYRVKWCCIMLNEFLPVDSQRRSFARDAGLVEQRKQIQLNKVCEAIGRLSTDIF
jgi:thiamine kinase-like enzyme